nr:hypothetical protein [Acidobacteriota bacterium]
QYDAAAALYAELAKQTDAIITSDVANLRLAAVYESRAKRKRPQTFSFLLARPHARQKIRRASL